MLGARVAGFQICSRNQKNMSWLCFSSKNGTEVSEVVGGRWSENNRAGRVRHVQEGSSWQKRVYKSHISLQLCWLLFSCVSEKLFQDFTIESQRELQARLSHLKSLFKWSFLLCFAFIFPLNSPNAWRYLRNRLHSLWSASFINVSFISFLCVSSPVWLFVFWSFFPLFFLCVCLIMRGLEVTG